MPESWNKVGNDYEVSDTVIIRKVNKTELLARKAALEAEIAIIQADIDQIDALEA